MTSDFAPKKAKYPKTENPQIAQMGISKIKRDRCQISLPLYEIGVAEQEYDVRFCTGSS